MRKGISVGALSFATALLAMAGSLLGMWAERKEIEEQVNERVDAKFAEMYGEETDEET